MTHDAPRMRIPRSQKCLSEKSKKRPISTDNDQISYTSSIMAILALSPCRATVLNTLV
jgi:hypothetical protein